MAGGEWVRNCFLSQLKDLKGFPTILVMKNKQKKNAGINFFNVVPQHGHILLTRKIWINEI